MTIVEPGSLLPTATDFPNMHPTFHSRTLNQISVVLRILRAWHSFRELLQRIVQIFYRHDAGLAGSNSDNYRWNIWVTFSVQTIRFGRHSHFKRRLPLCT